MSAIRKAARMPRRRGLRDALRCALLVLPLLSCGGGSAAQTCSVVVHADPQGPIFKRTGLTLTATESGSSHGSTALFEWTLQECEPRNGRTDLSRSSSATARILGDSGNASWPAWITSSESSLRSCIAVLIDRVSAGVVVRLVSKPRRSAPRTTSRSSSAPACVAQKKHSWGLAPRCSTTWLRQKPSHEAPTFG